MKTLTKNNLLFFICAFALLFAYGCSGTFSVDLTSADSTKQLRENISKEIKDDDKVVEIRFGTSSSAFTSDMEMATVNYYEAGKTEAKCLIIPLGVGDTRTSRPNSSAFDHDDDTNKDRAVGVKFSEVDFSKIHTNMAKAIAIMESDSVNMPYSGIGDYTMKMSYPDKITHTFKLQSAGDTKAATGNRGLTLNTTYYECEFVADAQGNVVMKKK